jgi:hypothetical protein
MHATCDCFLLRYRLRLVPVVYEQVTQIDQMSIDR